jgi:hypothetical protein
MDWRAFWHRVHLQHLVAIVVDDLHRDLAGFRRVERDARRPVQLRPLGLVDLSPQCFLELLVWLIGAAEVGVTDEEALAVVLRVDEPARDVGGAAATDLAGSNTSRPWMLALSLPSFRLGPTRSEGYGLVSMAPTCSTDSSAGGSRRPALRAGCRPRAGRTAE